MDGGKWSKKYWKIMLTFNQIHICRYYVLQLLYSKLNADSLVIMHTVENKLNIQHYVFHSPYGLKGFAFNIPNASNSISKFY